MSINTKNISSVLSVHDVMPECFDDILRILEQLDQWNVSPVTLLVVPGRQWSPQQLGTLQELQQAGFVLAGHGWQHEVIRRKGLYHKLHGLILSRMVAEHLSLTEQGIAELITRCHNWFVMHELTAPYLYVPPAWAMGRISRKVLDTLPFMHYENFAGVYHSRWQSFTRLPLAGYEADNPLRHRVLNLWNRYSEHRARRQRVPLRICIHPRDLHLGLFEQIKRHVAETEVFMSYDDAVVAGRASPPQ